MGGGGGMKFYRACMRCSSLILFCIAIVTLVVTFAFSIREGGGVGSTTDPYGGAGASVWTVLAGVAAAINNSAHLFFYSALIWVLRNYLPGASRGEAG
jgi:hypothetical protein